MPPVFRALTVSCLCRDAIRSRADALRCYDPIGLPIACYCISRQHFPACRFLHKPSLGCPTYPVAIFTICVTDAFSSDAIATLLDIHVRLEGGPARCRVWSLLLMSRVTLCRYCPARLGIRSMHTFCQPEAVHLHQRGGLCVAGTASYYLPYLLRP